MDVLNVVQQLRDLASDPQNRAAIVRDQGCLPGLVIFLDNEDPQVVLTALEALYYLAQVPSNRLLMKNEVGLVLSLRRIMNRPSSGLDLSTSAQNVHELLCPSAAAARPFAQSRATGRANVFLGASNRKARLIVVHIPQLVDQESKSFIEQRLLEIKGVISFTFDISRHRCFVRSRNEVNPEVLCRTLIDGGIHSLQQVVKNEQGDEVFLSYGANPKATVQDEKENAVPLKASWHNSMGCLMSLPIYHSFPTISQRMNQKGLKKSKRLRKVEQLKVVGGG
ncbi:hypothetical protein EMCRGX_G028014 [Ephydatia muelleri]